MFLNVPSYWLMLSFHLFYHFFRFFALNRNYNISLSNLIQNVSRANPRFVSAKYSYVQNEGIPFGTHKYWQFYYLDWRLFAVELHGKSLSSLLWDKSDVGYDLRRNNSFFNVQFIKIHFESPLLCGFLLFYALMFECLQSAITTF